MAAATVVKGGPYFYDMRSEFGPQGLVSRAAFNTAWAVHISFATFWVTGFPLIAGTTGAGPRAALYVHDTSAEAVETGSGGVSNVKTNIYATFVNSGDYPIYRLAVMISYVV